MFKTSITNRTVWPDYLEDALLQALFSYSPTSTKTARRQLRHFPSRNKYISQYIFSATGVKRSASKLEADFNSFYDLIINKNISLATPPEEDLSGNPSAPSTPPIANDIYTVRESELLAIPHYLHQDCFSPLFILDQPAFELPTSNKPIIMSGLLPPECPNIPFHVPHHHNNLKKLLDLLYCPTPCYPSSICPPPIAFYVPQIEDARSSSLAGAVHPLFSSP
ncbi:hypothetical protein K443DRAFT_132390 [Laccaria amethystina LaAM-08-1]|uniref:TEA domain-containing protein n=1 Tax=Laccaria amethystina LaAM-08-1 TaxID=1095629 RepID=A0A0C9WRH6_9AGAR|nr:hypothetical protein K443DRAFT_132390 [Laccaria amethystina LaAM-08-1]